MILVSALSLASSLASATLLGMALGRAGERARLLAPVILGSGERRLNDYAAQLSKAVGGRRVHRDPDNAARIRKLRIQR